MGDECRFDEPRTTTIVGFEEPIYAIGRKRLGLSDGEASFLSAKGWLLFAKPTPLDEERHFELRRMTPGGYLAAYRHLHESETKYGVRWEGDGGDTVSWLLDQFHRDTARHGGPVPGLTPPIFGATKPEPKFVGPYKLTCQGNHFWHGDASKDPCPVCNRRATYILEKDGETYPYWGDPEFDPTREVSGSAPIIEETEAQVLRGKTSQERKDEPIYSGAMLYFPDALAAIARLSRHGNIKHNPGEPMHWAREKSNDHLDCVARHILTPDEQGGEGGETDLVAAVWRAMAELQLHEEKRLIALGIKPYSGVTA